jgi:hypothetical protein
VEWSGVIGLTRSVCSVVEAPDPRERRGVK